MKRMPMNRWLLALMYVLSFILLREWLLPVMMLTNTAHLNEFLYFIILAFVLSLVKLKWFFTVPIKAIYIFMATHYIYLDAVLFSKTRTSILIEDLISNFAIIAGGNWDSITDPFRTIMFFVLLWMTTYLICYWIETRKSIFLFYFVTVLFIALLDTFSPYSADGAIIRIMVTGLLLLGLLTVFRLAFKHGVDLSARGLISISVPLLFFVVVSSVLAIMLPDKNPVWPDPVPHFKSFVGGAMGDSGDAGISKSGYGPDDTKLGGPFLEDNTLVFEATVDKRQYWKVETKNTYTSKGWEQIPFGAATYEIYLPGMHMAERGSSEVVESNQLKTAKINMIEDFPFLVYPYGMTKTFTDDHYSFLHLSESGHYRTRIGENEEPLEFYELEYVEKNYSLRALRATTMDSIALSDEDFTEYLQLPDELPNRVGELAKKITASSESVYDKTKAIEQYFDANGYTYDQRNVAVPGKDDDYVDQFLFETKTGYCDNFSTSMVVMLRTIGIPSRWVKGFAPGEVARYAGDGQVYHVTNKEAHSWVEAYMPGIGWMPFEPTIGFSGQTSIAYDLELKANDSETPEMPDQERERLEQEKKEETKQGEQDFDLSTTLDAIGQSVRKNSGWIIVSAGVLLLGGWGLYLIRRKWIPKLLVSVNRSRIKDWDTFAKMYKSLLKQFDRTGLKRKSGETLSTFAIRMDTHFGGESMKQLTAAYEKGIYGGDKVVHDWVRLQEMWEDLMNRTSH